MYCISTKIWVQSQLNMMSKTANANLICVLHNYLPKASSLTLEFLFHQTSMFLLSTFSVLPYLRFSYNLHTGIFMPVIHMSPIVQAIFLYSFCILMWIGDFHETDMKCMLYSCLTVRKKIGQYYCSKGLSLLDLNFTFSVEVSQDKNLPHTSLFSLLAKVK